MKKRVTPIALLLCSAIISVPAALAEETVNSIEDIAGTWRLESVAPGLDKARVAEDRIWEFRPDGVIVTSGFNRHFKTEDRHEWKYHVENGQIMAEDPGRPGKTINYSVFKKEGDELILKGGLEGFYFFKK